MNKLFKIQSLSGLARFIDGRNPRFIRFRASFGHTDEYQRMSFAQLSAEVEKVLEEHPDREVVANYDGKWTFFNVAPGRWFGELEVAQ